MGASNHAKRWYIVPHKRTKSYAPTGIFWGFLMKQVKNVEELMELMVLYGAGSCAGSFGSCNSSGGKSIYGFTGTSPPVKVANLKNKKSQKALDCENHFPLIPRLFRICDDGLPALLLRRRQKG